jgi:hypothetical protein
MRHDQKEVDIFTIATRGKSPEKTLMDCPKAVFFPHVKSKRRSP